MHCPGRVHNTYTKAGCSLPGSGSEHPDFGGSSFSIDVGRRPGCVNVIHDPTGRTVTLVCGKICQLKGKKKTKKRWCSVSNEQCRIDMSLVVKE